MTSEHDDIRDLMPAVALGAATPAEVDRVEAAAAADPALAAELESLRQATDLLATDVPMLEPPPALRARVMDTIRAEAAAQAPPEVRAPEGAGRSRARGPSAWRGWRPLAAVAAVAAIALLLVNVVLLTRDDDPTTRSVDVVATQPTQGVSGEVVVFEEEDRAVMRLSGLPDPGPGRGYELWVVADGQPVSAGFLDATEGGDLVAVARGVGPDDVLAVTEEPLTNRVAPTSTPLASAEL